MEASISANLDSFEATQGTETPFHPLVVLLRAEVDRLTALMQGLLDYGKPIEPLRSPANIEAVIAEAVAPSARLAARAEVEVKNRVGPGLPAVLMDRKRLVQVFENILQNAIQRAPAGSTVFVDASREGGEDSASLVVTVSDSGPGLGADDLPRLFEPFFTRRRGGTGLGPGHRPAHRGGARRDRPRRQPAGGWRRRQRAGPACARAARARRARTRFSGPHQAPSEVDCNSCRPGSHLPILPGKSSWKRSAHKTARRSRRSS